MDRSDWTRKDIWTRRGDNFAVQVSRHEVEPGHPDEGPHRWCVYALVGSGHPFFARIDQTGSMSQRAFWQVPLHAGCSHFRVEVTAEYTQAVIGADYHHYGDEKFTHTPADGTNGRVFLDADQLFDWLARYGKDGD